MPTFELKQIGTIKSPHKTPKGTPIQPTAAKGYTGTVEVYKEYVEGLQDLDGFSYIYIIYYFHLIKEVRLKCVPFMDESERGIFSIRGPTRPNPVGFSVVKLNKIEGNILHVEDIDVVNNTPLIDIKPYIPEFDHREGVRIGWLEKNIRTLDNCRDDGRFLE